MIIYNVTIKTDWSIHDAWVKWMQEEHIPDVLGTGLFFDHKMMRLMETDDTEGPTYAVQYHTDNMENYNLYISQFAPAMREKGHQKWGNKFAAFRSVLQTVN